MPLPITQPHSGSGNERAGASERASWPRVSPEVDKLPPRALFESRVRPTRASHHLPRHVLLVNDVSSFSEPILLVSGVTSPFSEPILRVSM